MRRVRGARAGVATGSVWATAPVATPVVAVSESELLGGESGALDPGGDLGEGEVAGGRGVVGEGGEPAVVAGAEAVDGQEGGRLEDAIADLLGRLDAGVDRIDHAHEDP